jgi:hypothetical protein
MTITPRTRVISASCKRCQKRFKYLRAVTSRGRLRYYCEPCRVQERVDTNDCRPRRTAQRRCTHWSRQEAGNAHPA